MTTALRRIGAFFGFGVAIANKEEVRAAVMEKGHRVAASKAERSTRGNVSAQKGAFVTKAQIEREIDSLQ